jgi:hypothetical protein
MASLILECTSPDLGMRITQGEMQPITQKKIACESCPQAGLSTCATALITNRHDVLVEPNAPKACLRSAYNWPAPSTQSAPSATSYFSM